MPAISRRTFLKAVAGSSVTAALAGCQKPRRWVNLEPYVRPPEEQLAGVATWYATTCHACPAGCGIVVRVMNGRALKIEGNPEHPLNQGKLCARGQASLQQLYHPDRVQQPLRQEERGSRRFQPLAWEEALNSLVDRLQAAGSRFAIWEGSATPTHLHHLFQRFTTALGAEPPLRHDLYAAFNQVAALQAPGTDSAPGSLPAFSLSQADLVLSFGADFLGSWLAPTRYGVEFGRFRSQPFGKRGYFVQVEPRMSPSGAKADLWLPARPGSEPLVAQTLVQLIADQELGSQERIRRARELAPGVNVDEAAASSDLSVAQLERLADLFAAAERPVVLPGPGTARIDTILALNTLAAAEGSVLPFAATPVPALSPASVSAASDIQALLERMRSGQVEILFVHGSNPLYDLPARTGIAEALAAVPFVVSFAPLIDETAAQADLILPDHTPLEGWGYQVVTPNFGLPVVGSQQPVVSPLGDTRATGDLLLALATRLPDAAGALPWADEVAYIEEIIRQLPPGAADGDDPAVRVARFRQHGGWWPAPEVAVQPAGSLPVPRSPSPVQVATTEGDYPYLLHLYLSELLGDGQGAALPWLQSTPAPMTTIAWQSWLEIHPETAATLGVENGDLVRVRSAAGELEVPVYLYPAIRPDTVAMPLGQGHTDLGRYARNRGVNPVALLGADASAAAPVPVQLAATGRHINQATFENVLGVREGFENEAIPG